VTRTRRCRRLGLSSALVGVVLLAGCSSSASEEPAARSGAAGGSAASGSAASGSSAAGSSTAGADPADPTPAVPTPSPVADDGEVATDPDHEPSPEAGGGGAVDVQVVTSFAGWDEVSGTVIAGGYVTGVVEDGGTCTLTLSRGGRDVVVETSGLADASTTACGGLEVAGSSLGGGRWSAVLSYRSGAAAGTAEPVQVDVP
jgi:hypothetical protein